MPAAWPGRPPAARSARSPWSTAASPARPSPSRARPRRWPPSWPPSSPPPGEHADVRYDHGQRLVRELAEFEPPALAATIVRPGGSYLITGGAGGLGLISAAHLAEAGAGRITLAGRSELAAGQAERLAGLHASGTRIDYRRTDVSSAAEVERLIAACGPLHGIIHAAGVSRDRRTVDKSRAEMADVLAPKVSGAVALDAASATCRWISSRCSLRPPRPRATLARPTTAWPTRSSTRSPPTARPGGCAAKGGAARCRSAGRCGPTAG